MSTSLKAILNEDVVIKISQNKGTPLKASLPPGIGFKRLRVVDGIPIDLATLSQIWVRGLGGQAFELHAMEVNGAQLVNMTYSDFKKLVSEDGVIRVRSEGEMDQAQKDIFNVMLKNRLRQQLTISIGDEKDQIADHFKLSYLMLDFILTGDPETKQALEEIKASMEGLYDATLTKERLLVVSNALKDNIPTYYKNKQ